MRKILAASVILTATGLASAAMAQATISPGQTLQAALTKKDSQLGDGSHYRCYQINTAANTVYEVIMMSDDIDTYLAAGPGSDCDDLSLFNDDGPDIGTNSQIKLVGDGGVWTLRANSLSSSETGRYSLRVSPGERVVPTTQIVPIGLGESRLGELVFSDRRAEDGSFYDCYTLRMRQQDTLAIQMGSDDFDSYLSLYPGDQCQGEQIASDDDGGAALNAQIVERLPAGTYSFRTNSLSSDSTGSYTVTTSVRR